MSADLVNGEARRTIYDQVEYPSTPFEYAHPNRMATIATLYGMQPAAVRCCRVLELGCGAGGNLIPMAYQNPASTYVGVDLSGTAISHGQAMVDALGLKNITLRHCDILDVDDSFATFDYIIAHGVYSWVPQQVRDKILAISQQHLNPHGVSYISYNAHPYSRMRDMLRDMLLFHTRHLADPKEKVKQARAIAGFLTDATEADSVHGAVMREQNKRVQSLSDSLLLHDDLNEGATAFLLRQVIDDAGRRRLQYLGDVDFFRVDVNHYPEAARKVLLQFPDSALADREQYQDFIDGNGFRRSLFCREDVALQRRFETDFIKAFYVSAKAEPRSPDFNIRDDSPVVFDTMQDIALTVSDPLWKAALFSLGRAWPSSRTVTELLDDAIALLGQASRAKHGKAAFAELCKSLALAALEGIVAFRVDRPDLVMAVSDRPRASALARRQAEKSNVVTNLLHNSVLFDDSRCGQFLQFVDGTRTVEQLHKELQRLAGESGEAAPAEAPDAEKMLTTIAKLGLLIA